MTLPEKRVPTQAGLDKLDSNPEAGLIAYREAVTKVAAFAVSSAELMAATGNERDTALAITFAEGVQVLVSNVLSQHIDELEA